MKIGKPCKHVYTEYKTLCEYAGRRYCKVFDADVENGIILEERICPGSSLLHEKSFEKRIIIFSSLYNGLHIIPNDIHIYLVIWLCDDLEKGESFEDSEFLINNMITADYMLFN